MKLKLFAKLFRTLVERLGENGEPENGNDRVTRREEMDGEVKSKYLPNQPASVHSYARLTKSDSPRTHTSPTSLLRKYPHSLRHDQKHKTRIKRNSSPVTMILYDDPVKKLERDVKSWCLGDSDGMESESDESVTQSSRSSDSKPFGSTIECRDSAGGKCVNGDIRKSQSDCVNRNVNDCKSVHDFNKKPENANSPQKDVVLPRSQTGFTTAELRQRNEENGRFKIGSFKKLSVINNSLDEWKDVNDTFGCSSVDKVSDLNSKICSPVHKSTPNLLRSEPFGVHSSVSHPERITDRLSGFEYLNGKDTSRDCLDRDGCRNFRNQQVPLKNSDSLPQLNQKYRFIHSLLPKINRTISESNECPKNFPKGYIKSDSQINSNFLLNPVTRSDSYRLLTGSRDSWVNGKSDGPRSDEESESLIEDRATFEIQCERNDGKNRWSCRRPVDKMPSLRNLMTRRNRTGKTEVPQPPPPAPSISIPLVTTPPTPTSGSCSSLNSPAIRREQEDGLTIRKCDTMYALTDFFRTDSTLQIEPMKPINRLRVPPNGFGGSNSRMCSRCSSLLSMASSSRYSINTTGSGFVPCSPASEKPPEPNMLCKLCLLEVPLSLSMEINQCGCVFCRDCMKLYVEFEIQEGAYDISCPDAQCHKQGIVTIDEVELLVSTQMMERYMRFRLNHEVDLDMNRTWCPRAGCETVCNICPRERCSPTSVHCPTCDSDFCSNCKNPWHRGLTCEENSRKLAREGHTDFMEPGIPFDSDLIKCCPMCNVPIEKDEGCAQMMCKRCKHVFCWYCLASLDDDFLLRHYDKGPCKNKLGHSRASVIWHRTQVIGIFAGFGILLLVASPLLLVAAPCIVCCKCRVCSGTKMDPDEDLPEESGT
ncbi:UNVERIFIED_CONTAM: hypothetical protein PYX00_008104 [Menopon gallinae]|uniref:E3 ubiquitin-protein ligase RNF144B n=2 Tax=Menopon gallinae TaxID=328185 RepID=A0AAW2HLL8_9NEOP